MPRAVQGLVVVVAAIAILLGYRQASAAMRTRGGGVVRVCVAGLRLDLARGAQANAAEGPAFAEPEVCAVDALPRGLPGERLLSASTEEGSVSAYRMEEPPEDAMGSALGALEIQGWREAAPSALARRRGAMRQSALFESPEGALFAAAVREPRSGGSLLIAVAISGGEEVER